MPERSLPPAECVLPIHVSANFGAGLRRLHLARPQRGRRGAVGRRPEARAHRRRRARVARRECFNSRGVAAAIVDRPYGAMEPEFHDATRIGGGDRRQHRCAEPAEPQYRSESAPVTAITGSLMAVAIMGGHRRLDKSQSARGAACYPVHSDGAGLVAAGPARLGLHGSDLRQMLSQRDGRSCAARSFRSASRTTGDRRGSLDREESHFSQRRRRFGQCATRERPSPIRMPATKAPAPRRAISVFTPRAPSDAVSVNSTPPEDPSRSKLHLRHQPKNSNNSPAMARADVWNGP